MSTKSAENTTSRDRVGRDEHELNPPSPSYRASSSRHGSKHDRTRHEEHRERSSHSRRDADDGRKESSSRRRRDQRSPPALDQYRDVVEEKHRSSSSSKRYRDDDERDERKHRRHYDEEEHERSEYRRHGHRDDDLHRRSKGSSQRREEGEPSRRQHSSSSRRDREGRASRDRSSRDYADHTRPDSRSHSPKSTASTSMRRPSFPPRRSASIPTPSLDAAAEEEADDAPNFAPSGLLAAESNTVNGVALKYHEPPEARKPKSPWRLYCFKDGKEQEVLRLASQSAYLLGRDRTVVDIPLDHESCSKQHAVLQFRQTITTNEFGDKKKRIQPFLIDLESSNGSYVNNTEIPASRYYQLRTGDTLTFGASTREYVLLDEGSS